MAVETAPMTNKGGGQVQISVRIPAEQVGALERIARDADRTLSAEIRRLVRQHVAAMCQEGLREAA